MSRFIPYLSLFGSFSTLICCALPSLFVALGAGAVLSGLLSEIPQLIWISENKKLVFLTTAVLMGFSGVLLLRARNLPCPLDPKLASLCTKTRRNSEKIYVVSIFIFAIGFLFAFVLPAI